MEANQNNHQIHLLMPDREDKPNISLEDQTSDTIVPDQDRANYVYDFFVNIRMNLANAHPFDKENYIYSGAERQELSFELRPVDVDVIEKEVEKLKIGKPSAIENIST